MCCPWQRFAVLATPDALVTRHVLVSKFKVLLTIVVGITLTATSLQAAPVSAVAGFGDVATDDYYAQPVQWARNNQIINIEGACFSPNTEMTRGETAVHLWKMQDRPPAPPHSFVDITNQDHQEAVAWLTDANLTTGATDTTFDPDGFLTRAHIVTFLWRLKGEPAAPDRSFDDVTANWQQKSVGWALQEGITNGTSAKTFSPNQRLNRAQMLTFLWRYKGEPQVQFERESPVCEAYGTTSGTADAEPVSNIVISPTTPVECSTLCTKCVPEQAQAPLSTLAITNG